MDDVDECACVVIIEISFVYIEQLFDRAFWQPTGQATNFSSIPFMNGDQSVDLQQQRIQTSVAQPIVEEVVSHLLSSRVAISTLL